MYTKVPNSATWRNPNNMSIKAWRKQRKDGDQVADQLRLQSSTRIIILSRRENKHSVQ
jgi:hypothetical protein